MKYENLKKLNIPDKAGVYFFMKRKQILYIGKATSLKDRVKSYFGNDLIQTRGPIILDMVFQADKIEWQITDSVLEAIIIEANLIKKYQPKYNTKEKSDKALIMFVLQKKNYRRWLLYEVKMSNIGCLTRHTVHILVGHSSEKLLK